MADDYSQIMPTYAPSMVALQQRQKMADLLRQQSLESPQGQTVSGHYVAPSWTQYAAQLLKGYMGGKMSDEAAQGQADLGKQLQAAKSESVNQMVNTMPGSQYATTPDKAASEAAQGEALFKGADVTSPEAQAPVGQTVMQTRPNTDQDVTKWLLNAQQANPEGAGLAMKMYEMQQQRDAAKTAKETALINATNARSEMNQNKLEQIKATAENKPEPLVAVAGKEGPVLIPRSQASGMTPYTPATIKAQQQAEQKEIQNKQGSLSAQQVLDQAAILYAHPGRQAATGSTSWLSSIPGTEAKGFQSNLDTFKAQTFIPMVSALKGMGALSDAEGKKLSDSVGALDPKMPEKEFEESLKRTTKYLYDKAKASGLNVQLPDFANTGSVSTGDHPADIQAILNKHR